MAIFNVSEVLLIVLLICPVIYSQNDDEFIEDCLEENNRLRALHGVPPLTLSQDLNDFAQNWAEHLADIDHMAHNPVVLSDNTIGENLAHANIHLGPPITCDMLIQTWYEGEENYNYQHGFQDASFSQLIWKSSEDVGFGRATSSNGEQYFVANYKPAGNKMGQFKDNVLPPIN